MADETQASDWLVEPPGPGQVIVRIAPGEGVELTEAQRTALDALLVALQETDEVSGYGTCLPRTTCDRQEIVVPTCAAYATICHGLTSCVIQKAGSFGI